jgi:hypothetical protein
MSKWLNLIILRGILQILLEEGHANLRLFAVPIAPKCS